MKNSYLTVTDQFCGAGGSSQGVHNLSKKMGGGLQVQWALNHWALAIETHNTNFPDTNHDCTDIQACDPRRYHSTDILITSPECTNHSLAKGKKRKFQAQLDAFGKIESSEENERSRATMWDVPRFAEYHDYNVIIVENVVDARYWLGWNGWLQVMHDLGYKHKCCYLNSMHFNPTPQSRDRMYVVFWKKGNPEPDLSYKPKAFCEECGKDVDSVQTWKTNTKKAGKYKQQYLYRCPVDHSIVEPYYNAAFNIIDWSIEGQRIGDRKKPLVPKTISRIEHGLDKYCDPMIITSRYTSGIGNRVKNAFTNPIGTQPGDVSHALCSPFLTLSEHSSQNITSSIFKPQRTQLTRQTAGIFVPFLVENYGTSKSADIAKPIGTQVGISKHSIVSPASFKAFLGYYYGGNDGSAIDKAINTVTTKDRAYLVTAKKPKIEDCHYRMLKPHEVQRAMAFDDDYIILGTGKEKVKQCGNAVTPPVMEWLVGQCVASLN